MDFAFGFGGCLGSRHSVGGVGLLHGRGLSPPGPNIHHSQLIHVRAWVCKCKINRSLAFAQARLLAIVERPVILIRNLFKSFTLVPPTAQKQPPAAINGLAQIRAITSQDCWGAHAVPNID